MVTCKRKRKFTPMVLLSNKSPRKKSSQSHLSAVQSCPDLLYAKSSPWPSSLFSAETTNPDFLISSFAIHKQLGIGREWSQEVQNVTQAELRYSYRFICNDNYYGDTCSKICTPRDDRFGHYTCKSDGQIACLPGWKGEYCQERKQEYKTPCGHLMLFVGFVRGRGRAGSGTRGGQTF